MSTFFTVLQACENRPLKSLLFDLEARERWDAEIAEAIKAHEVYLAEYGSLGDILREYHFAEE